MKKLFLTSLCILSTTLHASLVWSSVTDLTTFLDARSATLPTVGIDSSGDAVALYLIQQTANVDTPLNVNSRAYDASAGTWASAQTISFSNATNYSLPSISMISSGDALGAFAQGVQGIFPEAGVYSKATNTWSVTVGGAEIWPNNAIVAANEVLNGILVVNGIFNNIVLAQTYTQATDTWSALTQISTVGQEANNAYVAIDSDGDGVAVWEQGTVGNERIFYSAYDRGTNTWTAAAQISNNVLSTNPRVQTDSNGNAIAVWDGTAIKAARYTKATDTWTTETTIGTGSNPDVGVDTTGNAVATWRDTTIIEGAVFDVSTTTWAAAETISETFTTAYNPSISVDSSNNAVVVWVGATGGQEATYSVPYSATSGTWSTQSRINTPVTATGTNTSSKVSLNDSGQAVAVWEQRPSPDATVGIVQAATVTAAVPPASLTGRQLVNNCCSQTEFFNEISWPASTTAGVTAYAIYRNGVQIATVSGQTRSYQDHNRIPGSTTTYGVASITADGTQSPILSITI